LPEAERLCERILEEVSVVHGLRVGRPQYGLLARLLGRRRETPEYGAYCRDGRLILWLYLPSQVPEALEAEAREILEENFRSLAVPPEHLVLRGRDHVVVELLENLERYAASGLPEEEAAKLAGLTVALHLGFLKMVEALVSREPAYRQVGVEAA